MKRLLVVLAAGLFAAPAVARADTASEKVGIKAAPAPSASNPKIFGVPMDQIWAGAGMAEYTHDMASATGLGVGWNAGFSVAPSNIAAAELMYTGASNTISNLGLSQNFHMLSNALGVNLKIDPIQLGGITRPYLLGGFNVNRMTVVKNPELSSFFRSDTAFEIPVGAGLDFPIGRNFFAGARGTYNFNLDNEVIPTQLDTHANRWLVLFNVGVTQF